MLLKLLFCMRFRPLLVISNDLFFYLIVTLCFAGISSSNENENYVTINIKPDGNNKIITVPGNSTYEVNAIQIPINASAIIFQAHAHVHNLTMFDQMQPSVHHKVTGKNIGMLIKLQNLETEGTVWLSNKGSKSVSVLIVLSVLKSVDPFPGDCNMEFPTPSAPYLRLKSNAMTYVLEYQHARLGSARNEPAFSCSFSSMYISYDVYVSFLEGNEFGEENYFKRIRLMSDVSWIKQSSTKVQSYSVHPDTRFTFVKYPNLGVIYNVIAKYTLNGQVKEAAYVPVASYGCVAWDFTEYGCSISYSVEGKVLLFILSIYGFVVAFFGYLFVGPVIFFFGLLASFLVGLTLLGKFSSLSPKTTVEVALVVAIIGASICLILWLWSHNFLILLLMNGLVFGFLLSAIVLYTPVGNFQIFFNIMNFWGVLLTGTILIAMFAFALPNMMTILGSSVVGCYALILFYDDFFGTRLSYIILNIIKRVISEKADFAVNDYPFQTRDIIMTSLWVGLSILAALIWTRRFSQENRINCNLCCCCFSKRSARTHTRYVYVNPNYDKIDQPLLVDNRNAYYQTF